MDESMRRLRHCKLLLFRIKSSLTYFNQSLSLLTTSYSPSNELEAPLSKKFKVMRNEYRAVARILFQPRQRGKPGL